MVSRRGFAAVVVSVGVAVGLVVVPPATAEPRQGASGHGVVTVRLVRSGDSYTWGPWRLRGAWRTDDGATYAGAVSGETVTSSPPTPAFYIPQYAVAGTNSRGSLTGWCDGTVDVGRPRLADITTYCQLWIGGAALTADYTGVTALVAVRVARTSDGYVVHYRGAF